MSRASHATTPGARTQRAPLCPGRGSLGGRVVDAARDGRVARLADRKVGQGASGQVVWRALRAMLVGSEISRAKLARALGVGEQQVDKWLTASTVNMPTAAQFQELLTREDLVERERRLEALAILAREWGVEVVPIEDVKTPGEMSRPLVVQSLAIGVQAAAGHLAAAVSHAVNPESEAGEKVSPNEARQIAAAAEACSSASRATQLSAGAQITGASKHGHPIAPRRIAGRNAGC